MGIADIAAGWTNTMTSKHDAARLALAVAALLLSLALQGPADAQTPGQTPGAATRGDTVSWTVAPQAADSVKPGSRLALTLRGDVLDGWHVYALNQLPDGPTPLRVALEPNDVAKADGAPSGSSPTKIHDRAFNLETQFYAHAFTVTAPVRVGSHLKSGRQLIPLSVRFQTCNGDICQPPRTIRLTVPINVWAEG